MKKLTIMLAITMAAIIIMGGNGKLMAQNNSDAPKILIAYFSHSGNTRVVAEQIQKQVGGELFEIKAETAYPSDYNTVVDQAKQEMNRNHRPKLAAALNNPGSYDVIILGYPNWWSTMPMPVFTFLETYDFSGKTIIPFCTHEGSRLGSSVGDLRKVAPNSAVLEGLAVRGGSVNSAQGEIAAWLKGHGLAK